MFTRLQRGHIDERMVVVRRAHEHGIKLVRMLGKPLAEIFARERLGMLLPNLLERIGIDVAQPGENHIRMLLQHLPIKRRNASPHADIEDLQLAVFVGLRPRRRRKRRDTGNEHRAVFKKSPPRDG
jgi:hypothetical protein